MMYLNPDRLIDKFPSAYPSSVKDRHPGLEPIELAEIWRARVIEEIIHYSRYIDSSVGDRYALTGAGKFPNWDVSPSTPAIISEICFLLSYAALIEYYVKVKAGDEDAETTSYKDRAESILEDIREGRRSIDGYSTAAIGYAVTRENQMTDDNFSGFGR